MDISINSFMYLIALPMLIIAALLAVKHNKEDDDNFEDR